MKRQTLSRITGLSTLALAMSLLSSVAGAQSAASSKEAMQDMPRLQAKRVVTVTGNENWSQMTGFGKDTPMVSMMTLMMVGGSGMEHMKMKSMKMGDMSMSDMAMSTPPTAPASASLPVTVTLTPNPPIVGDNTLDVLVTDTGGKPVTGLKWTVSVAMTSMDMGTAHPKVTEGKDGHYTVPVSFSMKGPWRVTLLGKPAGDSKLNAVTASLDFNVGSTQKWAQPAAVKSQSADLQVKLNTLEKNLKVGKNMLDFTLLDPAGKPITGAKVTSTVEMTSMDMGTTHPKVTEGKSGHYTTEAVFSMKGPWRITLTVTPPNQKPYSKSFDLNISE